MENLSDSNDDEDDFFIVDACAALLSRTERSKIYGYADNVVPLYSEAHFRRMFRMSTATLDTLCDSIADFPELKKDGSGGKESVPVRTQLLLTLWYLGGLDTVIKIADRFGVSESTVIMCRTRIIKVILNHLKEKFICWPFGQQAQDVVDNFSKRNGFPGILGALDGTHIQIKAPQQHPQSYINRKNYHSIQLQAVCDSDMNFIHCFAGFPRKCHDARVLRNSDLWEEGLQLCGPNHIIGDAAYPLRRWLMTPFKNTGHLTQEQRHYNYMHSSNRVVIERAFSLLKGRFRRLQNLDTNTVRTAVNIIMACCVLHNICLLSNDEVEEFMEGGDDQNINPAPHHMFNELDQEGIIKRNTIVRNLP
ncbi:putative nuclease HARBI1 [Ylistrum balloti]|uniref:putative nuclease HARBI1 n=1 Tax=Ylistrum balloti TaxID=509963 RepID=UPI002905EEEA|nr:putative nuclease HARBI1 [Ylistrum balloti]